MQRIFYQYLCCLTQLRVQTKGNMTCLECIWTSLLLLMYMEDTYGTTVITSAPMMPVREGGIISLQCTVRDIRIDEHIKIIRNIGERKEILYTDGTNYINSDRFFVAKRRMFEGTQVYFLSITGVTREDDGIYLCKVMRGDLEGSEMVSAVDSVHIGVMYFPNRSEPKCSSSLPRPALSGTEVTLNCSSTISNPPVSFQWFRAGTTTALPRPRAGVSDTAMNRLYFEFALRLRDTDNGAVFICQISSPMFSGQSQTCHIGPFRVTPRPRPSNGLRSSGDVRISRIQIPTTATTTTTTSRTTTVEGALTARNDRTVIECGIMCSLINSPVLYWIIATITAGFLLGIFLTVALILIVKVRRLQKILVASAHVPS